MTDKAVIHVPVKTILIPPWSLHDPTEDNILGQVQRWRKQILKRLYTCDDRAGAKHCITLGDAVRRKSC